jgi:hypothetical protein
VLKDRNEALRLLSELGATTRLMHHAQVVSETADLISRQLQALGASCDACMIEIGAVLHDSGKIQHPQELSEPGSLHQQAGQALLLSHGVQPEFAKFSVTHASWNLPNVSLEERVVALADNLWRGKRESDLELSVIDEVALKLGSLRCDVSEPLDSAFESIAASGAERLKRSRLY